LTLFTVGKKWSPANGCANDSKEKAMKKQITGFVLAVLTTILITACGDGGEKGACIPRANPFACGNDFTAGQCDMMNGKFYPGQTCADLGYGSS
jgi:hypothetical protein